MPTRLFELDSPIAKKLDRWIDDNIVGDVHVNIEDFEPLIVSIIEENEKLKEAQSRLIDVLDSCIEVGCESWVKDEAIALVKSLTK